MLAIFLPIIAVTVGLLISLVFKPLVTNSVKLLLSFSGAFLLSIIIFEFLPEVYDEAPDSIGIFVMAGLVLQILLEFTSKGAEHGHVHRDNKDAFPWLLFLSLCLHAIVEGFPLAQNDSLLYGVVIHKIPIAIILTGFFFNSVLSKTKSIMLLIIFAFMTPLGSYLNSNITILQEYSQFVNAFVVGVLLHVSTTILFESSKNHQFNASKLAVIGLGILIAYFL